MRRVRCVVWRLPSWGAALVVVLGVGVSGPLAWSHGGSFTPPPPTPGGTVPRGTPRANTPTHVDPGMGGPIVTPGDGVIQPKVVGRRHRTAFTPDYEVSWQLWWDLNRAAFLPERPALLCAAVVTPAGDAPPPDRARWEADRDRLVAERVIPFLEGILDPAVREEADVRASSAIAYGKVARDATAINRLLVWLEDEKAPEIVRESAALGLGLLRRTDEDRRLGSEHLDPLRARLLMIFDRHVDGKRVVVGARARQFAMFAIGLLGDQPFGRDPQSKDGRLFSTLLWQRYATAYYRKAAFRVALLTALGMQPGTGLADDVRRDLDKLAASGKVRGRKPTPAEEAHALAATSRLGGPAVTSLVIRRIGRPGDGKSPPAVRLAAALALAERAGRTHPTERLLVARVLERALLGEQELLVMGLLDLALGRLLGADLAEGSDRLLRATKVGELLLERAAKGPWYLRGFGILALALAVKDAPDDLEAATELRRRASDLLVITLRDRTLEDDLRGAAAVGLGLLRVEAALVDLVPIVRKTTADPDLRGHAALAVGFIGAREPAVRQALVSCATGSEPERVRARAALGLSLLGASDAALPLVEQLEKGGRTSHLAGVTLALGHLGELSAVEPLIEVAADRRRPELVRAMAIVALGMLTDPEQRPSLLRLALGAPYPVRSPALEEAFTIL